MGSKYLRGWSMKARRRRFFAWAMVAVAAIFASFVIPFVLLKFRVPADNGVIWTTVNGLSAVSILAGVCILYRIAVERETLNLMESQLADRYNRRREVHNAWLFG